VIASVEAVSEKDCINWAATIPEEAWVIIGMDSRRLGNKYLAENWALESIKTDQGSVLRTILNVAFE